MAASSSSIVASCQLLCPSPAYCSCAALSHHTTPLGWTCHPDLQLLRGFWSALRPEARQPTDRSTVNIPQPRTAPASPCCSRSLYPCSLSFPLPSLLPTHNIAFRHFKHFLLPAQLAASVLAGLSGKAMEWLTTLTGSDKSGFVYIFAFTYLVIENIFFAFHVFYMLFFVI